MNDECTLYDNGHRFFYDEEKSSKEEMIFSCLCDAILSEMEDTSGGC